jgi:hypothetical protein
MVRKLKYMENETQTLFDLEYGKQHSKMWKMRNAHCRTWNMAIKLEKGKNEELTIKDLEYG